MDSRRVLRSDFTVPRCTAACPAGVDIPRYIRAVKEGGRVLRALGYQNQLPLKIKTFYWNPEWLTIKILKQVFNSRFAEVAMMQHVHAARDEMIELGNEFKTLIDQTSLKTPNLDELINCISSN